MAVAMREAFLFDDLLRNPPVGEVVTGLWWRGLSNMNVSNNQTQRD
jgi:hypothetical protein